MAGRGGDGYSLTTRVLQLDLAAPADVGGLEAYDRARVLLRYGRHVVSEVYVPVHDGVVTSASVLAELNRDRSARARLSGLIVEEHLIRPAPAELLTWSVVVCTRDRPELLRRCIESLVGELDDAGEIIVVDNAPATDATERIAERYPVRYIREDRPGLNRARALGAEIAKGEVVIYTDDDTVAEAGWVEALVSEFAGARVAGATGLTMPLELETEAQELFERYGGFSKGFSRRVFDVTTISPSGAGQVGSGASMAFRRSLILSLGLFEAELDLGTPSRTGGDTYALYRLLAEGYRIVYTPRALNWHQHRREHDELHNTMSGYGTGLYAFLTRALVEDGEVPALRVGMKWFRTHHLRELARAILRRPNHLSVAMVMHEIKGTLVAPIAYLSSRRAERARAAENVRASGKGAA